MGQRGSKLTCENTDVDCSLLHVLVTLRAKLGSAVYCYRSCLCVCNRRAACVCGSVATITQNCVHRSSPNQTRFIGKGSDRLRLIKFWPSRAPGKGVCGRANIFGSLLLQPVRSVCISLSVFFSE